MRRVVSSNVLEIGVFTEKNQSLKVVAVPGGFSIWDQIAGSANSHRLAALEGRKVALALRATTDEVIG